MTTLLFARSLPFPGRRAPLPILGAFVGGAPHQHRRDGPPTSAATSGVVSQTRSSLR
jgi:hypothetical protein